MTSTDGFKGRHDAGESPPTPLVTIGIPTFARAQYLREALKSSLSQDYANIEVLISDDGTESEIRSVGETAAAQDRRVRYWRNEKNLGLAGNWNRCLDESRGEYILIIGDDDRITTCGISTLVAQLEKRDDVVFGNHHIIDRLGQRLPAQTERCTVRYGRDRLGAGYLANPELVVWRNSIPICAALIRTVLARKIRFKEELNTPEIVLFAELASAGAIFKYVKSFISEYRVHVGSATSGGLRNDALAERLVNIRVHSATENCKRELLKPILINGVKICLSRGDVRKARQLVSNRYFSAFWPTTPHAILLQACLCLPGTGPALAYKLLTAIKRGVRCSWNPSQ